MCSIRPHGNNRYDGGNESTHLARVLLEYFLYAWSREAEGLRARPGGRGPEAKDTPLWAPVRITQITHVSAHLDLSLDTHYPN